MMMMLLRLYDDVYRDFSLDVDGSLLVFLEELLKTSPDSRQLDRARTVVTTVKARNSSDFLFRKLKSIYKQVSACL